MNAQENDETMLRIILLALTILGTLLFILSFTVDLDNATMNILHDIGDYLGNDEPSLNTTNNNSFDYNFEGNKLLIINTSSYEPPKKSSLLVDLKPDIEFLHYPSNTINYCLEGEYSSIRINRMEQAMNILELKMDNLISFIEIINCSESDLIITFEDGRNDLYVGLGGGGTYRLDSYEYVSPTSITMFEVKKNYYQKCTFPSPEIHELLHTFNIGHTSEGTMKASKGCVKSLYESDDLIFEHLKYVYSNGEQGKFDPTIPNLETI